MKNYATRSPGCTCISASFKIPKSTFQQLLHDSTTCLKGSKIGGLMRQSLYSESHNYGKTICVNVVHIHSIPIDPVPSMIAVTVALAF